ncbi:TonB-dependent siderophore receptor [Povalibacter sp.]|uniref:TonB-dependent siderophore receptor n=1 Tax=Povalibacter sp. TaxID=1962978 RepID=UPI002F419A35
MATTVLASPFCVLGETLDSVIVERSRYTSDVEMAGKMPVDPREIPASLSVITEQRMQDQHLTSIADALTQVTGVTVVPNDGVQSQYRSRGYALGLMLDGVPAYSSFSGYGQLDPAVYERIEVLRGPTGLLQGSGEPGGSANLVSKRGRDRFGLTAAVDLGSWNDRRASLDVTAPLNTSGSLRGRAVGVYAERDSFVDLAQYERRLAYGNLDWDITGSTTLSLNATSQSDRSLASYSGLPAFTSGVQLNVPRSTSVSQPHNRNDWDTVDMSAVVTQRIGNSWRVVARWWHRDQQLYFHDAFTVDGVRDSDFTVPFGRRRYDYDYSREAVDVFATGEIALFGRTHRLLAGYNYDSFDQTFVGVQRSAAADVIRVPFDQRAFVPPLQLPYDQGGETQRSQSGFYLQARLGVTSDMTLILGGRLSEFDSRSRSSAPSTATPWRQGDRDRSEFTPLAGVVYDVQPWLSLYASYADIFTPQSTLRRADGESLDPRIGRQYEIGAKAEWFDGALQGSLGLFDLRDEGRSLADTANPGFFRNAGEVESKGWETEFVGSPMPGYEIQVGYARLDSQFVVARPDQQGDRFSAIEPKHSLKLWAIRRAAREATSGFTFGAGLTYQSGIEFDPRTQGGYTVANAMLGYRFNEQVAFQLNGSNLFDKAYYARLGPINAYNTFGAPRNYSLGVRATF